MYREKVKQELIDVIEESKSMSLLSINNVMESLQDRHVLIYGAGSFGKQMYDIFKKYSVNVEAFLDISEKIEKDSFDIPVYTPDDSSLNSSYREKVIVFLSIVLDMKEKNELIKKIKSYGYRNVVNAQSIRCLFVKAEECELESPDYNYYKNKLDDILRCVDLWEDETSVEIYKGNVISHVLRNYKYCLESDERTQYFLDTIKFKKGFSRFIDCGAYIGDTLQNLNQNAGKCETIVAFEPEVLNFEKLNKYVNNNIGKIADKIILYPCGVGRKTELVGFKALEGSSSISKDGSTYVQCVAIDDAIKNFNPTFVKMDIEGAEYNALLGAKNTIFKSTPDLAICVYHYINHLWDIPLLLNKWNLNYKFYLKAHSSCGMETVMYATSN